MTAAVGQDSASNSQGLDGSRHRSAVQQPSKVQDTQLDLKGIRGLLDDLLALVPASNKNTAQDLAKKVMGHLQKASPIQTSKDLTLTNLRKVVAEEVKAAFTGAQMKSQAQQEPQAQKESRARSWASVTNATSTPAQITSQNLPKKVIPQRITREILVRGNGLSASLAKRSSPEIIQAINQTSARKGAIAARKLPSNDTIITFQDATTKDWHAQNTQWIRHVFGEQARESCRTFAVLLKGLRRGDLQGVTEDALRKELDFHTVDKVKFRLPANPQFTRATVLVTFTSQEDARRACDEGVVWRAQLLDCEPYWAALEPTQCYKCWKWGHTQRYCRKVALCSRCGTKAHGEGGKAGEAKCPTHGGAVPCRCPACGGQHPAWSRDCPEREKARAGAKEAYQHRPRTFEAAAKPAKPTMTAAPAPTISSIVVAANQERDDDGFQEVRRKRVCKRRPTIIAPANRTRSQTRNSPPHAQAQQALEGCEMDD
jgi:hypothetical protein